MDVEAPHQQEQAEKRLPSANEEDLADAENEDAFQALVKALQARNAPPEEEQQKDQSLAGLLAAQIETADVVLLNKIDLVDGEDDNGQRLDQIQEMAQALAPRAKIQRTLFGRVTDLNSVLTAAHGNGVALAGLVDDHHDAVQGVSSLVSTNGESSHEHSHDHSHEHHGHSQNDPTNNDASHDHDHSHSHVHSHDHSHDHNGHKAHNDPTNNDPSHDHDHSHSHVHSCDDPDCTDPSHQHDAANLHAGIGSFVYHARRPFHPSRVLQFLKYLNVTWGLPEEDDEDNVANLNLPPETQETLRRILRCKGFSWFANSHRKATYWSHAGKSFELSVFGTWWAVLPRGRWPQHVAETILHDFDNRDHEEDNGPLSTVGDRRQDIVVIGVGLHDPVFQKRIVDALDACLLNDEEWDTYQRIRSNQEALDATFPLRLSAKPVNY